MTFARVYNKIQNEDNTIKHRTVNTFCVSFNSSSMVLFFSKSDVHATHICMPLIHPWNIINLLTIWAWLFA